MNIIIDTREQQPYLFEGKGCKLTHRKLDTGDYSFEGCGNAICVDRKKSLTEIANNLGRDYKRFRKELIRMQEFDRRIFLFEFDEADLLNYPDNVDIPPWIKKKIRVKGPALLKKLDTLKEQYDLEYVFAGTREAAEYFVYETLLEVWESLDVA